MKMLFEVIIDTDEATPEELEEALTEVLRNLDLPDGDTLYISNPNV